MNLFFLEEEYRYGKRVDGYFWSIGSDVVQSELPLAIQQKKYDIRAFLAPMLPTVKMNGVEVPDRHFEPFFDHWAIIAENQTLARELMGRPLPTQGFQVLAFALALGFKEIHLTGIDLYESTTQRYAFSIPDRVASKLRSKDTKPGYELNHSRDRDISLFWTCREQYPEARLYALSDSRFLRSVLKPKKNTKSYSRSPGKPKHPHFRPHTITLPDGTGKHQKDFATLDTPQYCKVIDGKRCAFVTFVTGDRFSWGAKVLARSLAEVTDVPLVIMSTRDTRKEKLFAKNVIFYDIEEIGNPNTLRGNHRRFESTYTKLQVFGLPLWDRLVFLDADTIVLQNIDELFAIDEFAAAPDIGIEISYDRFTLASSVANPPRSCSAKFSNVRVRFVSTRAEIRGSSMSFLTPPTCWIVTIMF